MSTVIAGPAYRIETQRLVVRCWNPPDAPLLKAAIDASLEHLRPWMPWAANEPEELPQKIALMRYFRGKFDLGQDFCYGVFPADESRVLGGCGLHLRLGPNAREIGYWIHKDFIGQGLATEMTAALTRVAFEIDQVDRVEIHCAATNRRSASVPRKLGYTHEATLRGRALLGDGSFSDRIIWTMFADQYPHNVCAGAKITAFDAVGQQIL